MIPGAEGHSAALLTILIWATIYISTKILLIDFAPVEILFFRFTIGLVALLAVCPHGLKGTSKKQELLFAAAGLVSTLAGLFLSQKKQIKEL